MTFIFSKIGVGEGGREAALASIKTMMSITADNSEHDCLIRETIALANWTLGIIQSEI